MASYRPNAKENFKRLLAHLEDGKRRREADTKTGATKYNTVRTKQEMQAELEALEAQTYTISQRMHDLKMQLSKI